MKITYELKRMFSDKKEVKTTTEYESVDELVWKIEIEDDDYFKVISIK